MNFKSFVLLAAVVLVSLGGLWGQSSLAGSVQDDKEKEESETYMGVYIGEVTESMAERYDLPNTEGVYITSVSHSGPAYKAGLRRGDIVVALDGAAIKDPDQLRDAIKARKPGDKVEVTALRAGERQTLMVTLGERKKYRRAIRISRPLEAKKLLKGVYFPGFGRGRLGIHYQDLNEQLGEYFGRSGGDGVLVTEVDEDSPAEKSGIKAGDVIIKVGEEDIEDGNDLLEAIWEYEKEEPVVIVVVRRGQEMDLNVELEKKKDSHRHLYISPGEKIIVKPHIEEKLRKHLEVELEHFEVPDIQEFDFYLPEIELPEIDIKLPDILRSKHFHLSIDGEGKVIFNGRHFDSMEEFKKYLESEEFEKKYKEDLKKLDKLNDKAVVSIRKRISV